VVITEEFDYWDADDESVPADDQAAAPAGEEDAPDEENPAAAATDSRPASPTEVHHSPRDAEPQEPQEPWVPFAAVPRLRRVRSTPIPPEEETE